MLFDSVIQDIQTKQERKVKGLFNGIPFPFDRYRDFIPSIDKGSYHGLLAGPGVGKSRLLRYMYVYYILKFAFENNYPVKILYFALEDSTEAVYKKIICHYLWERQQIETSTFQLDSKVSALHPNIIAHLRKDEEFYKKLEDSLYIINDCVTPKQIFEACTKAHEKFASIHHMIALIDNYSNITKDSHHKDEWEAIAELSRQYVRLQLCKRMDWTVVAVLQQDMDTEKNAFRNAGKATIASLEPNLASIGGYKLLSRDTHFLFGLFSPWRYEILSFPYSGDKGYNIDILRNRYRSLTMIKSNEGEMAPRLGLYFNGKRETFSEMPILDDKVKLENLYTTVMREEEERRKKFVNLKMF